MNLRRSHNIIEFFNQLIDAMNDYMAANRATLLKDHVKLGSLQKAVDVLYQDISPGFHFPITLNIALPRIEELDAYDEKYLNQRESIVATLLNISACLSALEDENLIKSLMKVKININALFHTYRSETESALPLSLTGSKLFPFFSSDVSKHIFSYLNSSKLALLTSTAKLHDFEKESIIREFFSRNQLQHAHNRNVDIKDSIDILCGWIKDPAYLLRHQNMLNDLRIFVSCRDISRKEHVLALTCLAHVAIKSFEEDQFKKYVEELMKSAQKYKYNEDSGENCDESVLIASCLAFLAEKKQNFKLYDEYTEEVRQLFFNHQGSSDFFNTIKIAMKFNGFLSKRRIFHTVPLVKELWDFVEINFEHAACQQGVDVVIGAFCFFLSCRDNHVKFDHQDFIGFFKSTLSIIFSDKAQDKTGYAKKCAQHGCKLIYSIYGREIIWCQEEILYFVFYLLKKYTPSIVVYLIHSMEVMADKTISALSICKRPIISALLASSEDGRQEILDLVQKKIIDAGDLLRWLFTWPTYNLKSYTVPAKTNADFFRLTNLILKQKFTTLWVPTTDKTEQLKQLFFYMTHAFFKEALSSWSEEDILVYFECMNRARKISIESFEKAYKRLSEDSNCYYVSLESVLSSLYFFAKNSSNKNIVAQCVNELGIILPVYEKLYFEEMKEKREKAQLFYRVKDFCNKAREGYAEVTKRIIDDDNKHDDFGGGASGILAYVDAVECKDFALDILDLYKETLLKFLRNPMVPLLKDRWLLKIKKQRILSVIWKLIDVPSAQLSQEAACQLEKIVLDGMTKIADLKDVVCHAGKPAINASLYQNIFLSFLEKQRVSTLHFLFDLARSRPDIYFSLQFDRLDLAKYVKSDEIDRLYDVVWEQVVKNRDDAVNWFIELLRCYSGAEDFDGSNSSLSKLLSLILNMYREDNSVNDNLGKFFEKIEKELIAFNSDVSEGARDYRYCLYNSYLSSSAVFSDRKYDNGLPSEMDWQICKRYIAIIKDSYINNLSYMKKSEKSKRPPLFWAELIFKKYHDLYDDSFNKEVIARADKRWHDCFAKISTDIAAESVLSAGNKVRIIGFCSRMRSTRQIPVFETFHLFSPCASEFFQDDSYFSKLDWEKIKEKEKIEDKFIAECEAITGNRLKLHDKSVLDQFESLCKGVGMNLLSCMERVTKRAPTALKIKILTWISGSASDKKIVNYRLVQCAKILINSIFASKEQNNLFALLRNNQLHDVIKLALVEHFASMIRSQENLDALSAKIIIHAIEQFSLPLEYSLWKKLYTEHGSRFKSIHAAFKPSTFAN